MQVKYEFVNGEVKEIEVDAELGALLLDLDREEYNNDHAQTRRHTSLDRMDYEGGLFAAPADTAAEALLLADMAALCRAMGNLSPSQRTLLQKVFFEGQRIVEVARAEGVTEAAVRNRLKKIYERLKKNLF